MKKKRFVLVFGAIIITLLMISSATAININQIKNIKEKLIQKNTEIEKEIYIDPNIELTNKQLPRLKLAVEKIEKPEYKELTQKIIQTIENKGIVKSGDLKNILVELNMQNTEIYSGKIIGHGEWGCSCFGFPGLLLHGWIGPGFWVNWNAHYHEPGDIIDFTVGTLNHHITEEHWGGGIPFIGFWRSFYRLDEQGNPRHFSCKIFGWSPLIIIDYDVP